MLADEDLGNGPHAGPLGQIHARLIVAGDVDLLVRHTLRVEQALRADAVRADRRRVNLHGLHTDVRCSSRSKGSRLRAVDDDARACDPARARADEKGDQFSGLLRTAESAERDFAADELRNAGGVVPEPPFPRAAGMENAAGRERQDAYAARSELARLLVRQADERR